ncbi:MAG: SdrD B-like domain-containing protein [Culicoidibacterales bacterium]
MFNIIISFTIIFSMVPALMDANSEINSQTVKNQEETGINEVENSELSSFNETLEKTSGNDEWRSITAANFDINIGEQQNLTQKSVLQKTGANINGETKGININEKDLESLKNATAPGRYKIWLEKQGLKKEVTVEIVDAKQKLSEGKDAKISISIPKYSAAKGLFQEDIYDIVVNVDFGLEPVKNKKVEIVLPEGMRYIAIPVISDYKDVFVPANPTLGGFIRSVERPKRNTVYDSVNGMLTYNFTEGATKVEITGIKVTVDGALYYGPKVFKDGIGATALANGIQIGNDVKEINAVGAIRYWTSTGEWKKSLTVIEGNQNDISTGYVALFKDGQRRTSYIKKATMVYSYPKNAKVKSVSGTSNIQIQDDEVNFVLTYSIINLKSIPAIYVKYGLGNLTPGVYQSDGKAGTYTIETYDGTIIENKGLNMATKINVLSATDPSLNNKSRLVMGGDSFDDIDPEYLTKLPIMRIWNDTTLNPKKKQVVEIETDSTYEGYAISMPEFTGTIVSEIAYKTNLGKVGVATGKEIETTRRSKDVNARRITRTSVGLTENEYFIYGKALVGDIPEQKSSGNFYSSDTQALFILGRLKVGANSAKVTLRSWSDNAGQKESGSENELSRIITRRTTKIENYQPNMKNISIEAGKSVAISGELGIESIYSIPTIALKDPKIYLRIPQGFDIDPASISVTQDGKNVVSEIKPPYPIANGERGIAIQVKGKTGVSFDETSIRHSKFVYKYTLKAADRASGNYPFSELVFFEAPREFLPAVKDIYDVKGNGKQDLLGKAKDGQLTVQERKVLLIDTFIQPEGESKRPPYDSQKPETAVRFTPGTRADYTVDILNNGNSIGTNVQIYLPIPRIGNNFGTDFQQAPFKWNMKQDIKNYTFKVLDASGKDVTALKRADYTIEYSSDATTKENYKTATYRKEPSENDTMIRVINTKGIDVGQRVLLSKAYIVDETVETITEFPQRLGTINDFRPYYSFEAGSAGTQHGTAVGTTLMIGEIAGSVFNDEVIDGIFNNAVDKPLKDREVTLYKQINNIYQKQTATKSQADGTYKFSGLTNGLYRVDFNTAKIDKKEEFTFKEKGSNHQLDSDVDFLGGKKGLVSEIDPTTATAKEVTAGLISYDPANEFTNIASTKEVTLLASNAQKTNSIEVSTAISPKKFEQIQAMNNPLTWKTADDNIAKVEAANMIGTIVAGQTKGKNETTSVEIIATDMYENQAKETITVNILSNDIPVATTITTTIEAGTVITTNLLASLVTINDTEDGKLEPKIDSKIPVDSQNRAMTVGQYLVEYTGTDRDENSIKHVVTIDVVDTISPILETRNKTIIMPPEKTTIPQNWNQVFGVSASDNIDGDLTAKINYENDANLTSMNKPGLYKVTAKVADKENNEVSRELQLLITDKNLSNNEIIDANNFAIKLSEVSNANYLTRASAKAYSIGENEIIEEIAKVQIDTQIKPTSVGVYKMTFSTENKTMVSVDMVVIPDDLNSDVNEIITANSFSLKLSEVKTANYKVLAKVQGHDITDPNQVEKMDVSVVDDIRPTAVGVYPLIFTTATRTTKSVDMLILPEDNLDTTIEIVNANNFSLRLNEVVGADYQQLATAIAHDITDGLNIKRVPLKIMGEVNPTKEGLYPITFGTERGTTKVIQMLVLADDTAPTATDIITANNFSLRLNEVVGADYLSLSQAKGHNITNPLNITPLEVKVKTALYPDKTGSYEIVFSLASGTQKAVTMLVIPNDLPTTVKEVVNANSFSIGLKEVNEANYIKLASATGFDIENPSEIKSVPLKVENDIRPTNIGNYPITFMTNKGTSKTVDMLIIPDTLPAETAEIITAKAFKINLREVDAADYISLAGAVGHNISNPSNIVRVDIAIENDIRPEKTGVYQIIFITENGTKKAVDMVVADDNNIPADSEILLANSFSVRLNEVEGANYVDRARARAYKQQTMEPVKVSIEDDIRPIEEGNYQLVFRTVNGMRKAITMVVLPNDFNAELQEVIQAEDFKINIAAVATADYLKLAKARAFDITNEADIKEIAVSVETTTRPLTPGVHRIILTTEKGTKKEIKMVVVDTEQDTGGIKANDFMLQLKDVKTANYVELANAYAYYIDELGAIKIPQVEVVTATRPQNTGEYKIIFRTAMNDQIEVTMTIIDDFLEGETEVIVGKPFLLKATEVAGADYAKWANIKAYRKTEQGTIEQVEVHIKKDIRPTTTGIYALNFYTANGIEKTIDMIVQEAKDEAKTEVMQANDFIIELAKVTNSNFISKANARAYDVSDSKNVKRITVTGEDTLSLAASMLERGQGVYQITFSTDSGVKTTVKSIVSVNAPVENQVAVANDFDININDLETMDFVKLAGAVGYQSDEEEQIKEIPVKLLGLKPTTSGSHTITFATAKNAQTEIKVNVISTFVNYIELTGKSIELDSASVIAAIQQGQVQQFLIKEAGIVAKYHTEKESIDLPILIDERQLDNIGTAGTHDIEIIARVEIDAEVASLNATSRAKQTLEQKITIQLKSVERPTTPPTLVKTGDSSEKAMLLSLILLFLSAILLIVSRPKSESKRGY